MLSGPSMGRHAKLSERRVPKSHYDEDLTREKIG